ncbi:S-layer homology domain-containing protein [Oscillospiraceae bacterium WX1]
MKRYIKAAATAALLALLLSITSSALAARAVQFLGVYQKDTETGFSSRVAFSQQTYPTSADYTVGDYESFIEAAAERFVARDTDFSITITNISYSQAESIVTSGQVWDDIFSVDLPGTTSDLDYLHWNVTGYMHISGSWYNGAAIYQLTQNFLTTQAQEASVDAAVDTILTQLALTGSRYDKIKKIHDYILQTVSYDDSLTRFSAYDGLYAKKTVCNGYALLFDKMLLEAGIPVRIIVGTGVSGGRSESHAWNITKIGDYWYNVDATWDDTGRSTTAYFLKNNVVFSDHIRDDDYTTAAFNTAYPMSPTNYDPSQNTGPEIDVSAVSPWAQADVAALAARGVVPEALASSYQSSITRAEFTALMVNIYEYAAGDYTAPTETPFTDISGSPYATEIAKGYALGIVSGQSPTTFGPNGTLTREQCAKIIGATVAAVTSVPVSSSSPLPYQDASRISVWALLYVRYAYENGLMTGTGTNFEPQGLLSREQAMTIAERMIVKFAW